MREIVCVGPLESVKEHLRSFKTLILDFAAKIGITLKVDLATDPFYDASGSRGLMQKLTPVKEEFNYRGSLAIASLNTHRNFFGERCEIHLADGSPAFSGCVAFGLERWMHALSDHFGGDFESMERALA